jgi:hypothetical protein
MHISGNQSLACTQSSQKNQEIIQKQLGKLIIYYNPGERAGKRKAWQTKENLIETYFIFWCAKILSIFSLICCGDKSYGRFY